MLQKKSQILVPVGFSDQSFIALEQAVNLAVKIKGSVKVLSILDSSANIYKLLNKDEDFRQTVELRLKSKLESLIKPYEKKLGSKIELLVGKGKVYKKIIETANLLNIDMIVMGTDGADTNIRKKIMGSNASRVVSGAGIPVMTIKGKKHRKGCRKILLPLDFSKETKEKVNFAINFAQIFNSEIIVFSAVFAKDEFINNKLIRNFEQVKSLITSSGIKCSGEFNQFDKNSKLSTSVLNFAGKVNPDLIIIMTQSENHFLSHFIGSTAQSIINSSDNPVLSITPAKRKDTTMYDLPLG
ncbi:MAG: hypothetical protein CMP58_01935 [Flavobacteriales bacterium]|nr:hypothetical protein [Flavobacteriales bacterium]|tara:strand:+ start:267 stop:1160 length:894 start_codon:yes stop_codon:yes gene_type:complete